MQVAKWSKERGIESMFNYTFNDSYKQILEDMKYKTMRVTVPPNVRYRENLFL